jgi:uncharacterized protein (TIRG00374 family)
VKIHFLLAAVGFNFLYWVIWGVRLKVLSDQVNKPVKIGIGESIKIVISNLFLACITPSMAGGEPVRIRLLQKRGISVGGATATVLSERLLDAIFILICVPFAFFVFKDLINMELIKWGLYIGITVFVVLLILFLYAIKNPENIKGFFLFLANKFGKRSKKKWGKKDPKLVQKINKEVDNFHEAMVVFAKEGKRGFLLGFVLTVLFWTTGFMIPSMLLLGLGLDPVFIQSYAAQILLLVIIMMPTTPGSSGVAEIGTAALYAPLIPTPLLGVFVVLFRLITYHMNLIAGAIFQYKIFK